MSLYTLALFNRPVDWFHCVNCGLVIPDGDLCTLCINEALAMEREYAPGWCQSGMDWLSSVRSRPSMTESVRVSASPSV